MRPEPGLTVVVDVDDDPTLYDDLHRRSDVTSGVAVARPVPGNAGAGSLAVDLLVAIGKHFDALARERQLRRSWELTSLWARAERVCNLIVCDAERLPAALVSKTAELAAGADAHLWLVARGPIRSASVERLGHANRCSPRELLARLPVIDPVAAPSIDRDIALPSDNFLTFRATCKRLLNEDQFALVDAVYMDAHQGTRAWLRDRGRRESLGRDQVATQLRAVTRSSLSPAETVVRLRAAQAAYFVDGLLVELTDVRRLGPVDVTDTGLSRRSAARLRRLVTPTWACALALASVGGLGSVELARLNIDSLDPDGGSFEAGRREYEIPDYAAALVRAQLLDRGEAGGRGEDALLTNAKGDRFNPTVLGRRIDKAVTLATIPHADREPRAGWHMAPARGHGVNVIALSADWQPAVSV